MDMIRNNIAIIKSLMQRDFTVIKKEFYDDLINVITWPTSLAITFGYILPEVGMQDASFGSFLLIGAVATTFFYLAVGLASDLVRDFESLRYIDFLLVIPVSSFRIVFIQKVLTFAIHSTLLSIPVVPIGKILLGARLDLSLPSVPKFLLISFLCGVS